MNVLIANKFFHPNGGSEVVMFQERDFLTSAGHYVVDFSMHDEKNYHSTHSEYFVNYRDYQCAESIVTKLVAAAKFIHSPESVRKIASLIVATRPDILHCHNIYHQLTPSIIGAASKARVPAVLTLHDYKPVCPVYNRLQHGQPCSACLDGNFRNVLQKRCLDRSFGKSALLYAEAIVQRRLGNYEKVDRFIAPSRFMMDAVLHRFRREQVSLLYNGVDTTAIQHSKRDEGYVLYLGRLSPEKGIVTLLRAHQATHCGWRLVVAGTGPLEAVLKKQYKHARFLGHVSGAVLQNTIAMASVVVVPSEWYENCPMSVLEAMAYGKPVVGSRIGGIPELVVDGETGLLFKSGDIDELMDRLDLLMQDAGRRERMGWAARILAEEKFSLRRHNEGLMKIYRELLKEE